MSGQGWCISGAGGPLQQTEGGPGRGPGACPHRPGVGSGTAAVDRGAAGRRSLPGRHRAGAGRDASGDPEDGRNRCRGIAAMRCKGVLDDVGRVLWVNWRPVSDPVVVCRDGRSSGTTSPAGRQARRGPAAARRRGCGPPDPAGAPARRPGRVPVPIWPAVAVGLSPRPSRHHRHGRGTGGVDYQRGWRFRRGGRRRRRVLSCGAGFAANQTCSAGQSRGLRRGQAGGLHRSMYWRW